MSRTGKRPITLPNDVSATVSDRRVTVKGPKGEISQIMPAAAIVAVSDQGVSVSVGHPAVKREAAAWGTTVALVRQMMTGVTKGYEKKLEIHGVGYTWNVSAGKLTVKAGYSHPVVVALPKGISASVDEGVLTIQGIEKQLVGETAARIRRIRPPEPYKGKGIQYVGEHIRRKAGKQAVAAAT